MDNGIYSSVVNTIGLLLDIAGALLLFRYGLPSPHREVELLSIGETSEQEKERNKYNRKIRFWAYTGLSLLTLGFALQLLATWIPYSVMLFPEKE